MMSSPDDFKFNVGAQQFKPQDDKKKRNYAQPSGYYVAQVPVYPSLYYQGFYPQPVTFVPTVMVNSRPKTPVEVPATVPVSVPAVPSAPPGLKKAEEVHGVPVVNIDLQGHPAEQVVASLFDQEENFDWMLPKTFTSSQPIPKPISPPQPIQPPQSEQVPINTLVSNLRNSIYQFSFFQDQDDNATTEYVESSHPGTTVPSPISTPQPPDSESGNQRQLSWAQMAMVPSNKPADQVQPQEQVSSLPPVRFVVQISHIPRDITLHEVKTALQAYKLSPNPIVHFILDRVASAKVLMVDNRGPRDVNVQGHSPPIQQVFVEVYSAHEVKLLTKTPLKIRGRDVIVKESNHKDLLTALFPRYNIQRSKKQLEHELFFFVGPEEVKVLNVWCCNYRTLFSKSPSVPFEHVCSILHRIPWDHPFMSSEQRNALYETSKLTIAALAERIREKERKGRRETGDINEHLLIRLLRAALHGNFTDRQRYNILKGADLPVNKIPQEFHECLREPPRSRDGR